MRGGNIAGFEFLESATTDKNHNIGNEMNAKISFIQLRLKNLNQTFSRKAAKKEIEFHRRKSINLGKKLDSSFVQALRKYSKEDARYYHVAYSILKGNNYKQIERSCRRPLDPGKLYEILKDHHFECTFKDVVELLNN